MTPIDITTTNLTDLELAVLVTEASESRHINIFHKDVPQVMLDFGTFLVGCTKETIEPELLPFVLNDTDMVFHVPGTWTLAHVCKRLGMFPSVTQAMKNGKNTIPIGFSQNTVKVNHLKGVITLFKVSQ